MIDVENAIPKQDLTKVFPYAKHSGSSNENIIGTTLIIINEKAKTFEAKTTNKEGKELSIPLLMRNFLPDASIFYGYDHDAFFIGIAPANLDANLRLDNIDEIAEENLLNFINETKPLQMQTTEIGLYLMFCGGNYESVLPMLDYVWQSLQQQLENSLYVAIPVRDLCMFCTIDNAEAVVAMKDLAQKVFPTHQKPISKYMYKVEDQVWTVAEKIVD
jgi:uncharacterized protein YtpQ (UPF0354 family)